MIILALDLAGKTGYAIRYDTGEVKVGTWNVVRGKFKDKRSPVPMYRIWKRLNKLAETHEIGAVVFEETFGRGPAKFRLDSLQAAALLFCEINHIPWCRVHPHTWKKHLTGNGRATREQYLPHIAKRYFHYFIRTDDEAAAVGLLIYYCFKERIR